eukprot:243526_1
MGWISDRIFPFYGSGSLQHIHTTSGLYREWDHMQYSRKNAKQWHENITSHNSIFYICKQCKHLACVHAQIVSILVKHTANLCDRRTDCDRETRAFKELMKEQTLLVSIATLSTLLLWTLQAIIGGGSYFIKIDVVITVFSVFLTFKFNRSCFQWFQCDKMTVCCCDCIEQYPQWSTGDGKSHQLEMTQALSNNSQRTKRHNSVPTENVDELNALVFVD